MAENNQVPRFAVLQYHVLHELEISIPEYFLLDMIYRLSGNGNRWCNKKLDNIAADMRLTQMGVIKMRNRLIERKLLIKGVGNRLKTSEKLNSVYVMDDSGFQKTKLSSQKLNKVYPKTKLSIIKTPVENNKRITKNREVKDFRGEQPGPGKAFALAKLNEIKRRKLGKFGDTSNA